MRRALSALCTAGAILAGSLISPAQAAELEISDPAGDAPTARLDITTVSVRNNDHAVVIDTAFVKVATGFFLIQLVDRDGNRADIGSFHRPRGNDKNILTVGNKVRTCKGLRVSWDHEADTARVRLPSKCYLGGDYGAIRTRLFTEVVEDNDFAPNGQNGGRWQWSEWISRG